MLPSSFTAVILAGGIGVFATSADLFAVNYPIVAYPVSSTKDVATTYLVGCLKGTDPSSCDFVQPYTLIEGPKTVSFEFLAPVGDSQTQSFTLGCSLQGTTSMACNATGLADSASPQTPVTTTESITYTGQDAASFFKPIQIITNSASLMTHTPGATVAGGAVLTGSRLGDVVMPTSIPLTVATSKGPAAPTSTPIAMTSKSGATSLIFDGSLMSFVGIIVMSIYCAA